MEAKSYAQRLSNLFSVRHSANFSCSKQKVVTSEMLEGEVKVPAALNLPFGKLFFGFNVVPYVPPEPKPSLSPGPSSPPPVRTMFEHVCTHSRQLPGTVYRFWEHSQWPACSSDVSEGEREGSISSAIAS